MTREHVDHLTCRLSFPERIALSALAEIADIDGRCTTTIAAISDHCAMNHDLVRRAIREATHAGLLIVEPRTHLDQRSPRLSMSISFVSAEIADALWLHREIEAA